jgi:hypothetical protein
MRATQRYQDIPSDASTDVAAKSADENLESHAAGAAVQHHKSSQHGITSSARAAAWGPEEQCHRECHQYHGGEGGGYRLGCCVSATSRG